MTAIDYSDRYPMLPFRTGLCTYDKQGIIRQVSETLTVIMGFSETEMIGQPIDGFFPMAKLLDRSTVYSVQSKYGDMKLFSFEWLEERNEALTVMAVTEQLADHSSAMVSYETDHQTGLYNKRSILSILEDEVSRSQRYGQPLSLLTVSIGGFESLQKHKGSTDVDMVIQTVAIILKNETRDVDRIGRLDDSLFAVILPATSQKAAGNVARRVQRVTERYSDDELPFTVRCSFVEVENSRSNWDHFIMDLSMGKVD